MQRRILFLAHGLDAVSCRFRIFQYVPYLQRMGMHVEVADLRGGTLRRWRLLRAARAYDAVVIHRAFLNPLDQRWLSRPLARYIFDFDDAIMFRDSSHPRLASRQRQQRFKRMIASAKTVIAGNRYLAACAAPYNQRVTIIPTTVDLAAYPRRDPDHAREPVIGWIGTRINLMYLRRIVPALTRLSQQRPNVTLKIVSDGVFEAPGLTVINKPWSLADEAQDVMSFSVGIMPLPDDPWTRGKCALKALQYFAACIPVVCSPVGTNLDVVEHGRNGYFAETEEDWVARLEELLRDHQTRRRLGSAGRDLVEREYSVEANLHAMLEVLT